MSIPMILKDLRETLLRLIPPELFDESHTWKHNTWWNAVSCRNHFDLTVIERRRLLAAVQQVLQPLADCDARRPWRNIDYCPPTPYGDYHWMWVMGMVQDLLWLTPEFVAGYRFGRKPVEPYRDANPHPQLTQSRSWDDGYILGLCKPKKLRAWIRQRKLTPPRQSSGAHNERSVT